MRVIRDDSQKFGDKNDGDSREDTPLKVLWKKNGKFFRARKLVIDEKEDFSAYDDPPQNEVSAAAMSRMQENCPETQ